MKNKDMASQHPKENKNEQNYKNPLHTKNKVGILWIELGFGPC